MILNKENIQQEKKESNNVKEEEEEEGEDEQDTGHAKMIDINKIIELNKSICRLTFEDNAHGTGFFMMIQNQKGRKINCLVTNEHNISQSDINLQKIITIDIYNKKIQKLKLSAYERFIQCFQKPIDITIIEILDTDEIKNDVQFLLYDLNYMYGYERYKKEDVFIMQHPLGGNLHYASGKIEKLIKDFQFEHSVDTNYGSSGSPVILIKNSMVIGIHKKRNKKKTNNIGTFIGSIFNDLDLEFKRKEKEKGIGISIYFREDKNNGDILMNFPINIIIKEALESYQRFIGSEVNIDVNSVVFMYKTQILNKQNIISKRLRDLIKKNNEIIKVMKLN